MLISRPNPLTGIWGFMHLDVTDEQLERWNQGELIQNVMPHLSVDEREFLISGITPEYWDYLMEDR